MQATEKITKAKPASPALDYNFLREQGLKYLRRIAGKVWTDYNLHDPGVTILEQLCYALTDLGYRASNSMKDLIAVKPESTENKKNFYTATEILPCNPVTINDFRKVLIDVDDVKNAWLSKTTEAETKFYVDKNNKKLRYAENDTPLEAVLLNGLYKVILEFDYDTKLDLDLNSNTIKKNYEIASGVFKGYELSITGTFAYWDEMEMDWENPELLKKYLQKIEIQCAPDFKLYHIEIAIEGLEIKVQIWNKSKLSPTRESLLENKLKQTINSFIYTNEIGDQFEVVEKYRQKLNRIREIMNRAKDRLHSHRNLCEDFIKFESLRVEDIAICAEIEVSSETSTTKVLSKIYYEINKFLSPKVSFYNLEELLNKRKSTDEIFQGPLLNHGFIDNEELIKSDIRKYIHVSDFIQIIMSIEGVKAVRNIKLANMSALVILGEKIKEHEWCVKLESEGQNIPRLDIENSSVSFYKEGVTQITNLEKVLQGINELKQKESEEDKKDALLGEIPLPKGNYKDLAKYRSLQYDFPLTYGVNAYGLSEKVSSERKAQARQLKAYLMFMEQLLANYMSQLSHLRDLFSMDSAIESTSFDQPIYNIPGIAPLFKDFMTINNFDGQEEYTDKKAFQEKWKEYMGNSENEYIKQLNLISEGKNEEGESVFELRRNKFLDHLMARFCENFVEYAMLSHSIEEDKSNNELIKDKIRLLKDYPAISANRGKAFDYTEFGNTWDTDNVTGLERRIARLLGIESFQRKNVTDFYEIYKAQDGKYRWRITDHTGEIILNSEQGYNTKLEIFEIHKKINRFIFYDKYIQYKETINGRFYINIIDNTGEIIGRSQEFNDTTEDRFAEIKHIRNFIRQREEEGFHLVEHILLRPKVKNSDAFSPIDVVENNKCLDEKDPYSFKVTVILPAWPERFRHMEFRKFVEHSIRLEAPAHVFVKICWINRIQMDQFEVAYKDWLEKNANASIDIGNFMGDQDLLAKVHDNCLEMNGVCKRTTIEELPKDKFTLTNLVKISGKLNTSFTKKIKNKKTSGTNKNKGLPSNKANDLFDKFNTLKQTVEELKVISDLTVSQNKLLFVIQSLRNVYPYAVLRDGSESQGGEYPVSLDNTILGTIKSL